MRRTALFLIGLAACASSARAADCTKLDAKVAAATTAADHEALAKCYDARAAAARASGEEHKKLADAYRDYKRAPMGKHQLWSEAFAKTLDAEAHTYEQMAAGHRDVAKGIK